MKDEFKEISIENIKEKLNNIALENKGYYKFNLKTKELKYFSYLSNFKLEEDIKKLKENEIFIKVYNENIKIIKKRRKEQLKLI